MVDWPNPFVISDAVRDLKQTFLELMRGETEQEMERDLNYIVAVSSGKAVTEEIPKQIGRRAGWASQQGANFVELLIENPAQLIMDQDMLVNLASQLDLHYNIHSSTNLAYGMAYRVGRGNGYDRAHEYTVKLLKSIKRFRNALEARGLDAADDGYPRLYAVNAHMSVAELPPQEERLATDVSVDPFGVPLEQSKIFEVKEARLGIWEHVIWEVLGVKNDIDDLNRVLRQFGRTRDLQEFVQGQLVDILADRGYISDELLEFINRTHNNPTLFEDTPLENRLQFNFTIAQQFDMPDSIDALKRHVNGQRIAQQLATLTPQSGVSRPVLTQFGWDTIQDYVEEAGVSIPETKKLDLTTQTGEGAWDDIVSAAQNRVMQRDSEAFQEVMRLLSAEGKFTEEDAVQAMHSLVQMRMLHDDFNKESTIFRYVIPLWMPFAEEENVRQIWEGITGQPFDDHRELINWLYDPINGGAEAAMHETRQEEDVLAAATGAYVWGHFTQSPPGYPVSLLELIQDANIYWSFEAHMAGDIENARIWKPKDFVEVVKAINETPVTHETADGKEVTEPIPRTRVTIDMEHLATQKVDPMWVVDPGEEGKQEDYKGLDDGDGKHIMINHVTHPYIGEGGHYHGPVRRGDTLVYRYLYTLIDKGMATDPDLPAIVMYEIGAEKDETLFMLRLILRMIEYGIKPDTLEGPEATQIINQEEPDSLRAYLIQKFFGVTDTEVQHEWQEIFEHALDPLDDLLEGPEGSHTWMGRAATEAGTRPEDWQQEEYQ